MVDETTLVEPQLSVKEIPTYNSETRMELCPGLSVRVNVSRTKMTSGATFLAGSGGLAISTALIFGGTTPLAAGSGEFGCCSAWGAFRWHFHWQGNAPCGWHS